MTEVLNDPPDEASSGFPDQQWEELPNGLGLGTTWNLLWTWSKPRIDYSSLLIWQRVNHFPRSRELTRKDLLKRNISQLERLCIGSKMHSSAFDIMPVSFVLPHEYTKFVKAFYDQESAREEEIRKYGQAPPNFWILKPVGMSRGRGISLISDLGAVKYDSQTIVQHYLRNPLLLDGYKFDLRLYVLVTSFNPLEVWLYQEGFVRLSTHKFSLSPEEQGNLLVHLTNSSIQKHNTSGFKSDSADLKGLSRDPGSILYVEKGDENEGELGGTKRTLKWLWKFLAASGKVQSPSRGGAAEGGADVPTLEGVWGSIQEVIIKSLLAVDGEIPNQPNAFEVFGYDIILDDSLRPWLLEVNASPSMARECELDKRVKEALIRDTVALIDPLPFDRDALVTAIEQRRQAQPHSRAPLAKVLSSILGSRLPRQIGEPPRHMGNYEALAPGSSAYLKCCKIKAAVSRTESKSMKGRTKAAP